MRMVNQQFHLFELKAGRSCQYMEPFCRQSVVRRLFRFWKTRNVKKGGELMGFIWLCDLSRFDVTKTNQSFRLSDSHVSIRFTDQTKFHELPENKGLILMELFRFGDYDHSMLLANTNTDLPDIVGDVEVNVCLSIFVNLAMQLLDKWVIHGVEPQVIAATNINPKLAGGMHVPD
ncbi:hypothetical protein IGI04_013836 [Brassica rapa subsp. trilocularis]|uniref:DUF223 domain-containing protein n=1 Tax=Brassica rapa subsp. trilocularis TaxID=1813537 RepID=A0ABQ7N9Z7_BRACM|nr:hypothetical protein IGI04_013836 [Brassica rapa subsp. trilocularis]